MAKKKWDLLIEPYLKLKEKGFGCNVIAKELGVSKSLAKTLRIKTNSQVSERYLYNSISFEEYSTIIACVLGDGGLFISKSSQNNVYGKISCIIDNKDYLEYKKSLLKDHCTNIHINKYSSCKILKDRTITNKTHIVLNLKSSPYLKEIKNLMYVNGKKAITKELLTYFNDMTLAFLYYDDGSYTKHNKVYRIAMGNMEDEFIKNFRDWLIEKYSIETSVHNTYGYKSIYIKRNSFNVFESVIKPYCVNSMRYKIRGEVKLGEFGETPEVDNTEPSISLND